MHHLTICAKSSCILYLQSLILLPVDNNTVSSAYWYIDVFEMICHTGLDFEIS